MCFSWFLGCASFAGAAREQRERRRPPPCGILLTYKSLTSTRTPSCKQLLGNFSRKKRSGWPGSVFLEKKLRLRRISTKGCQKGLPERIARKDYQQGLPERIARTDCQNALSERIARTHCQKGWPGLIMLLSSVSGY